MNDNLKIQELHFDPTFSREANIHRFFHKFKNQTVF